MKGNMEDNIIAIRKIDIAKANEAFAELMCKTENEMNKAALGNPNAFKSISPSKLEVLSTDYIKKCCIGTPFSPENINLVSGRYFPDIIAEKYFGVEVKSTSKDHWCSIGSSVVESSRDKFVENIYMLFGNLGGNPPKFKCRPYQDVLSEITVTHSPRYLINMELTGSNTIFDKMGITYDEFRTGSDSIERVRRYYRNKALSENKSEMPWWLTSIDYERTTGFSFRLWSDVDMYEKSYLHALSMVLFPETLTPKSSKDKYTNMALWLCAYRQIVCPNIRDVFSAGGQIKFVDGKRIKKPLPKIFATIVNHANNVKNILKEPSRDVIEMIKEYNPILLNGGNYYDNWLTMCQNIADSYYLGIPLILWVEKQAKFVCS